MLLFEGKILTSKYLQTQQNGNSYISGVEKKTMQQKITPHSKCGRRQPDLHICVQILKKDWFHTIQICEISFFKTMMLTHLSRCFYLLFLCLMPFNKIHNMFRKTENKTHEWTLFLSAELWPTIFFFSHKKQVTIQFHSIFREEDIAIYDAACHIQNVTWAISHTRSSW